MESKPERRRAEIYFDEMKCVEVKEEDRVSAKDITERDMDQIKGLIQAPWEEVAQTLNTPRQAAAYCLTALTHGGREIDKERFGRDYWMSGKKTHDFKVVDCDDGAMVAGSLLKDNGFSNYILCMTGRETRPGPMGTKTSVPFGHAVFIYKTTEGDIGSIGINKPDVRSPRVKTMEEFLQHYSTETGDEIEDWHIYDIGSVYPDYDTNSINNNPNP
jgi:hypothetical protein